MLLVIAIDFDAQDLCGRPQIAQLEVFGEISKNPANQVAIVQL